MDPDLQRLLDERAIERLLVDYCRGVDRLDAALVASVYHRRHRRPRLVQGPGRGFADHVTRRLAERYEATMHSISNVMIAFTDPDSARVESHVCARHRGSDDQGPTLMSFGGRYVDRFERRDGTWKIAHRAVVHEWDKLGASSGLLAGPLPRRRPQSRRHLVHRR